MSRTAAIIGGGVIGGGWLARFLLNGWDVKLYDPDPDAARKIAAVLSNARHALPMLYESRLPAEGRLDICDTLAEAVAGADWVQESAPERLDLKHRILSDITTHAASGAIIGSSTSGFTPSDLQSGVDWPERIIVAHPFNPVYLLPLVELVGSKDNAADVIEQASAILVSLGMFPLQVRGEIDAHIADRLLEAVWREALWLVHDGVATTQEIDDAIRYGFGLRWAQMGLFETYRIAGGEAGMKHFIEQFGPALKWPWTKLTDVPELTDDLVATIASQSDAQSGRLTINELERLRDHNLVAMMRALKGQDSAAGRILNRHQKQIAAPTAFTPGNPVETVSRVIPIDWTDYNGHMNESRYGQVFSDAADAVMVMIGADETYVASGQSFFTVETKTAFLDETIAGDPIRVETVVMEAAGKKLRLRHRMLDANGGALASCDQLLIHVSLKTRRSSPPAPQVEARMRELAAGHADLARQAE
ncbi:carnitine 3-dehydrogenase [Hoeflea sp. WL0058]|uniref:L-carnitine dehydrogenase n=1 Tax=Flavimaribacter sediminis TaxID=2865987 RepID=A0AAE2ZNW9_9HYPH|nr:carnitine 3-dehydrogenase [Flavimaribacter sediminis]MBW8637723.1 carnitine 3-dehydrogenase [Flavimaribacter sediminis]